MGNVVKATGNVNDGIAPSVLAPLYAPVQVGGVYNLALPTLDDGDAGRIRLDVNGRILTNSAGVSPVSGAGWTLFNTPNTAQLVTNTAGGLQLKATAGTFGGASYFSDNAVKGFLQFFFVAAATTVILGTTVPDMEWVIPPYGNLPVFFAAPGGGLNFPLGLKVAFTTLTKGSAAMTLPLQASFWGA